MARTINSHIVLLLVTQNHRTAYVRKWCIYHFDKNTRPISRKKWFAVTYLHGPSWLPSPIHSRFNKRITSIKQYSLPLLGFLRQRKGLENHRSEYRLNFIRNGNVLTLYWIGIFYIWKGSAENWTQVSQVHSLCSYHDAVMPLDWNWLRNGVDLQYPRGNWSFESLA